MKQALLILFASCSFVAFGQKAAFDTLNVNNWSIPFSTRSSHGWDHVDKSGTYCPKEDGLSPLFAFSLWFGGLDDSSSIRATAATYRQNGDDYFNGPLKKDGSALTNENRIKSWNKVYKLERWEVEKHIQGKGTSQNIKNWPAKGNTAYGESEIIAPFVDLNNNGIYEPSKGDFPEMKGDQMLFIVNNDSERPKRQAGGDPTGIEIQTTAYAYSCSDNQLLNNTVFIEYKLINKGEINYDSFFLGFWADADLGYAYDDYVGSDSSLGCFFTYNGDNQDNNNYKNFLPIISFYPLDTRLSTFLSYNNDFNLNGNPVGQNFTHHYNYLRACFKNGTHLKEGGNGFNSAPNKAPRTNYMYSGNPFNDKEWSEVSERNLPGYRSGIGSTGPYHLESGDTIVSTWAMSFHRGASGRTVDAYKNMKNEIPLIKKFHWNGQKNGCTPSIGADVAAIEREQIKLFPNPTNGIVHIQSSIQIENVSILNMSGQVVGEFNTNDFDVSNLTSGSYLVKVKSTESVEILKLVINP